MQWRAEAGYKGERIVVLDPADIPQSHAELLVTNELLMRLGFNVELATAEWGTIINHYQAEQCARAHRTRWLEHLQLHFFIL